MSVILGMLKLRSPDGDYYQIGEHKKEGKAYYNVVHFSGGVRMGARKFGTKTAIYNVYSWMRGKV